jgi:GH35 family endo-1,4-beta-xylanase
MIPARETVYQIVDDLKRTGVPDDGNGSLVRVGPIPPLRDS